MNNKIRAGILGAGGFTGQELIRLFGRHGGVELCYITSSEFVGKALAEAFPFLAKPAFSHLQFSAHPQKSSDAPPLDVIFLATPDEVSLKWAPEFLAAGVKVVDIAGAFRLKDAAVYKEYYGIEHTAPAALAAAVYGMTEINRDQIRHANLVANPGCYPTAAILPLYVYRDLIDFASPIIVDAKSGTSGAGGRKEKDGLGYSTVYENFRSYKTAKHQHAPEIADQVSRFAGAPVQLRFTPHLLPMYRGIFSNAYAKIKTGKTQADFERVAETAQSAEKFLRFRGNVDAVELRNVQNTNYVDYAHYVDEKIGLVEIVSAIDNLMKGAAAQAVQNMNLMFGLDETTGVD
ncbi:MAG: N-acetyl-gamma-glutamyl-phosphate reductase [Spirochaetes bacterium]|nr:N-acetyl-gamma-glutamyl-phosphate reductase [Spirochaetota bacterium]